MAKNNNTLVFNGLMQGMSWDQIKEAKDEIKRHQGEKQPTRKDILTDWIIGKDYMLQQQGNSYQGGGSFNLNPNNQGLYALQNSNNSNNNTGINFNTENPSTDTSTGGSDFINTASQIGGFIGMFDQLGGNIYQGASQNYAGFSNDPYKKAILGDSSRGMLAGLVSRKSELNNALDDINSQVQQFNIGDNASLMSQWNTYIPLKESTGDAGLVDIFGTLVAPGMYNLFGSAKENQEAINQAVKSANARNIANFNTAANNNQLLNAFNQRQHMTKNGGHLAQEGKLFKNIKNKIADAMQADLNYSDASSTNRQNTINKLRGYPTFTFGGGNTGGGGASGYWDEVAKVTPETYWVMNTPLPGRSFSNAFAEAVKNNQETFWFNNKLYNTKRASSDEEYLKNRTKAEYEEPLNLRTVYDKDWNIYQDSTRIEPYIGQLPIIEKKKSKGGKLNKSHKFAEGGLLNTYDYGLEEVNAGGSHEENPNEGVIVSYAPDGLPNKVEEGETIHNDYVYSKRLEANEKVLENNLLDKKYEGKSFADISKKLTEDRKQRPNDPISVRTNEENLNRLQGAQEELKLDNKTREVKRFLGSLNNDQLNALQQEMMDEYEAYAEQLAQQQEQEDQAYQEEQAAQEGMFGRGGHFKQGTYGSSYLEREPWYTEPTIVSTWSNPLNVENKIFELSNPINQEQYGIYERDAKGEIKKSKEGKPIIKDEYKKSKGNSSLAPLRFAEAFGSAGQYLSDILGLTNQPDYSNARMYQRAIDNIGGVNFTPIGNYLTYTPIDTEYLTNQQMATAAARRNYNNVVGNYTLGLLGDYNTLNQIGATAIAARQQDQEQKNKVAEFNRATNDRNSTISLDAQKQNAALRAQRAQEYRYLADMMTRERDTNEAARAANYQNFMSNLAAIGREDFNYDQIKWMIDHGVFPVGAESYLTGLKI